MATYPSFHGDARAGAALDPRLLTSLQLFVGLPADQLSFLSTFLCHKRYPAGAVIIRADQPGEGAYIILAGTVKVHIEQPDGSNVILAILGPGQIVGEMSLTDSLDCSANVVTLEESRFLWLDRLRFQSCIRKVPELQQIIVQTLSARLRLANTQIQALARLDTPGRVARQILAFAKEYGEQAETGIVVPLRLIQDDLADLVGASRVHVSRVLSEYKRRGILSVDQRHYITIHDAEALVARCL